ncbi:YdcH family protein [Psychrobacter sp. 2Y5]|uniref:YdcH family protein n=1 Tax=unclassified Psychrobacter TaxID=196806 RepID=UPI003F46ED63
MRKTDTLQDNREIVDELRQKDSHFAVIFDEHTQLDEQINRLEKDRVTQASWDDEIEQMKRRKLQLKDEIYRIIDKNKLQSHA